MTKKENRKREMCEEIWKLLDKKGRQRKEDIERKMENVKQRNTERGRQRKKNVERKIGIERQRKGRKAEKKDGKR